MRPPRRELLADHSLSQTLELPYNQNTALHLHPRPYHPRQLAFPSQLAAMTETPERPQFSADEFFASQPPPARLEEHLKAVREFVERNVSAGRRVVLVTVSLLARLTALNGWVLRKLRDGGRKGLLVCRD